MSSKTVACPKCGAESVGRFCGECGERIQLSCPSCGKYAPRGAKFCQDCGTALTGSSRPTLARPWLAMGTAGVVLAIIGGFLILDRQEASAPAGPSSPVASATTEPNITPAEAAEQLFNHVMAASERGDKAEAQRFAPMALEAYAQLASLDEDAHYHVGLIHVTVGDVASARAELEIIRATVPDHLLGLMLEHAIAEAEGDEEAVARAYERFLSAYDREILTGRDEYDGHRTGLDGFRDRAREAVSGS